MRTNLAEYTNEEKSLLLYLETRLVDHMGRVDGRNINAEDCDIAKKLMEEGLIEFGRISMRIILSQQKKGLFFNNTNWVRFTDLAWKLTHEERRLRSERMIEHNYQELEVEMARGRKFPI